MNDRPSVRRGRLLVIEWLVFAVAFGQVASAGATPALAAIGNVVFLAMGTMLVLRRPANAIGSLMTISGWGWMSAVSADVAAERLVESGSTTVAGWVALVAMLATVPLLWINNVAVWLLFPDGRPATASAGRLLRWSAVYLVVPLVIGCVATPMVLGPGSPTVPHPFLDASTAARFSDVWVASAALTFVIGFVALGLLFARVRDAGSVERRQILLVAAGVAVYFCLTVINGFLQPLGGAEERTFLFGDTLAGAVLATAIVVAVVRYRLFELGRVVRRSLVFAGLAIVIAAVYVAVVVGVGAYFGDGADITLSIAATVAVALVFQPARRQLERWASRLVYGPRAEPQEVLSRFAHRAAELPDEELLARIPQLVAEGTSARQVALWARTSDGFRAQAAWPPVLPLKTLPDRDPTTTPVFDVPGADRSLPVVHDGELLGGLSIDKEDAEIVTPAEDALLEHLAGALGVAMRNARLSAELREQLAALESSRERLLLASDDARRNLEWALDSGPQQRLAALKVKLGPVRLRAERLGARRAADVLASLEADSDEAIRSVRRFAAGVYPPELESHGLAPAIRAHAAGSSFRLVVDGDDAIDERRFGRDTESAVYFTVLEAIQNAAKHADAETITVAFCCSPCELTFRVVDDGAGFEPGAMSPGSGLLGMTDRLDTVGGSIEIASSTGVGTTVTGRVPLAQTGESDAASAPDDAHVSVSTSRLNEDLGMNAAAPAASAEFA